MLTRFDFSYLFILDVDQSIKGVGIILSQKLERQEQVVAYDKKDYSLCKSVFILWKESVTHLFG